MAEKRIDVSLLTVGKEYTRADLSKLWQYGIEGLYKGIIPAVDDVVILLTTTEKREDSQYPYEDKLESAILTIAGQRAHGTDKAVLNSRAKIYSFCRDRSKNGKITVPFVYQGRAILRRKESIIRQEANAPSTFVFYLPDWQQYIEKESLEVKEEEVLYDASKQEMSEGARKLVQHYQYERNPKVRRKALKYHSHVCAVCGFDFDKVYGKDIADGYIEFHHIKALSSQHKEHEVDPKTDLVPLCANCHRMIHHHRDQNMTVEELHKIVMARKKDI